jgi:hypothetical protein
MFSFPQDKIGHLKAGAMAAAYGAALGAAMGWLFGLLVQPGPTIQLVLALLCAAAGAATASSSAGITKEKADAADNKVHPGMRMVEVADAVVTASPGAGLAAVLLVAAYMVMQGAVPPWMA